jgi:hypothetical protein
MTFDSLLIHRCTTLVRSSTTNDFGELVHTWANSETGVVCRYSSPSGSLRRLESGEYIEDIPKLFMKASQTIAEVSNRITGTTGFTGTYMIKKVNNRYNGSALHHKELDLVKVV